jgi:hypothetical protein
MDDDVKHLKAEIKRLRKTLRETGAPLQAMLKRKGFIVYRKEPVEDLVLPEKKHIKRLYEKLHKYSFRLFLRDVIKHQNYFTLEKVTRYATKEVSSNYLNFLLKTCIVRPFRRGYRLQKRPIKSFGETLEWFVAGIVSGDYGAETLWGVKFRRPRVGGDYDLIAKLDAYLLYMEIKSSPPKQIYDREIAAFFDRIEDLCPDVTIFFIDTELRMKDKIVPMFEEELKRRYKKNIPVERVVKELFHIKRKIFIINSKGGISNNIGTVLSFRLNKGLRLE